jgi:hypothetical protein
VTASTCESAISPSWRPGWPDRAEWTWLAGFGWLDLTGWIWLAGFGWPDRAERI